MALDISAHSRLTPVENPHVDAGGYPADDGVIRISQSLLAYGAEHYPGRTDGLTAGYYTAADCVEFRAGSYSGYNYWREILAQMSGWGSADACWRSQEKSGPFYELINFSDCEGYIGPVAAAKLAQDFSRFADRAKDFASNGDMEWFFKLYERWQGAFELAADGGVVEFH